MQLRADCHNPRCASCLQTITGLSLPTVACTFGYKSYLKRKNGLTAKRRGAHMLCMSALWAAMWVQACKLCSCCLAIPPGKHLSSVRIWPWGNWGQYHWLKLIILETANWFNSLWSQWLCPAQFPSRHTSAAAPVCKVLSALFGGTIFAAAGGLWAAPASPNWGTDPAGAGLGTMAWVGMQVRRAVRPMCTHLGITAPGVRGLWMPATRTGSDPGIQSLFQHKVFCSSVILFAGFT